MTPSAPSYRPCVGIVLANALGRIFAGQRVDHPGGAWQMPQGGIDDGESPLTAAHRELREETGVSADKTDLLASLDEWLYYDLPLHMVPTLWGGRFAGQKQKWFLFRFVGSDDDICIATENPEFTTWRWLDADAVELGVVPFKRHVYRRVLASFKNHL